MGDPHHDPKHAARYQLVLEGKLECCDCWRCTRARLDHAKAIARACPGHTVVDCSTGKKYP